MQTRRAGLAFVASGVWLSLAASLWSQTANTPMPNPPASGASRSEKPARGEGVQDVKPDVYYLKDKDGKLEPVLGFTLEDFERLLANGPIRGAGQARPGYRLDRVSVQGTVQVGTGQVGTAQVGTAQAGAALARAGQGVGSQSDRAELTVTFDVFVDEKEWVRVPLRLGSAVVRNPAKYDGPGEYFLEFDDESDEYVAWFHGSSEKPHRLSLEVIAPLTAVGGETRLKLSTPRAWNSQLVLKVPGVKAVGQVSAGAVLDSTTAASDGTQFKVLGLTSDFALTWRPADTKTAIVPAVLEAGGGLLVRIDGRSVNTQAELTVRSFGGEFDSFRVRLPPGAVLLTGDQPEFTLVSLPSTKPSDNARKIVEVRLRSRTAGPVQVRLATEQTYDVAKRQQWIELAGFEVLGAVRQWGHLAVQVVGDWQVGWGDRRLVRQVEDVPAELWRDNMLAGFEYFGQPCSLLVQVTPRQTRINVEPEYLVLVGPQRVELDARLKYHVGGAKAFSFEIDLAGWKFDEVGPAARVNLEELSAAVVEPLKIPLHDALLGDLELTLRAHRDVPADAKSVEFSLPRPLAGGVGSATVVVLPADNIDLAPRDAECTGLVRQFTKPTMKLPSRQQPPLVYRTEAATARFAAHLHPYGRRIIVGVKSNVRLSGQGGQVEQQMSYNIARESTSILTLQVPAQLVNQGPLEISLGNQPLTWQPLAEGPAVDSLAVPVRVALPPETIGTCELTIRYGWSEPPVAPRASTTVHVPLVMPGEGDLADNELAVTADAGIRFQNLDAFWQPAAETDAPAAEPRRIVLESDAPRSQVVLGLRLDDQPLGEATRVERAWIQSWLTEHARQERAVYRVATRAPRFHLRLPVGVILSRVMVDGTVVTPESGPEPEELFVPLATTRPADAETSIEVDYHFPERKTKFAAGAADLRAPSLDQGVWARRIYWEVVLPRNEVLLAAPDDFTDERSWTWHGLWWDSQAVMDQAQLESWSGVSPQQPLPPQARRYLFSSLGDVHVLPIFTVRLSYLVLAASGGLLLVGLIWVYVRPLRVPLSVLLAMLLVFAASTAPDLALTAGQAAILGLSLALLAGWLQRSVARRQARRAGRVRTGASSIFDRGSTQTHYRPPLPSPHATTTTTAPIVVQGAVAEGEP